jgi:HPt (histidine-containing phosphotransfer) domain-containing protein
MDEYIPKPVKMDELLFFIDKAVLYRDTNIDYHEIPLINENGELVFVSKSSAKSLPELVPVISQLDFMINNLMKAISTNNYYEAEDKIHQIKTLFDKIEAQELKDIAFKIELSARRGNYNEIYDNTLQMMDKFIILKKSINYN